MPLRCGDDQALLVRDVCVRPLCPRLRIRNHFCTVHVFELELTWQGNYSVRVCHGCRVNTLQRYLINCDVWFILKANEHAVGVDGVERRVKTSSTSAGVSKRSQKSSRKISQLRRKYCRFSKQQVQKEQMLARDFSFCWRKSACTIEKVELFQDALPSSEDQDRLLDAITLTTDVVDDDLREPLVNDEAFEQLDDSFVLQATAEDLEQDGTDDFDYDAHIAKLMEAARGVTPLHRGNLTDSENEDEFSDFEDEGEDRDDAQRVLDKLFEKTLAEEYDDEQLGELEENDPETRGNETLEGELLAAVVGDYVFVQQEIDDAEGRLGNPVRTGNRLKQVFEECEAERRDYEYDENAETEDEEEPEDQIARVEREKMELQELFKSNQSVSTVSRARKMGLRDDCKHILDVR
ncbi:hypothetical protein PsorP6_014273 [Peronosclerospora sorghi]|uniref:Uncharacterized protein n=1 Tax=Peronosclerospora sorghi TaxID=230839 RepID=A0ACC0VJD7_9STRA|nr:hypothetical protein PsorP6_014273 [Peronosclerospora sorghi]